MHRETKLLDEDAAAGEAAGRWSAPGGLREALYTALPLMVSSLSWTIMNFIDRIFLMWYSPDAVAAALPAGMVAFTAIAFPIGVVSYAATFVAQYEGAGRRQRIGSTVWQAVWIGAVTVPAAIALIPAAPYYFAWMQHPPEIAALEVEYFNSLSYSGGAMVLSGALASYFNGRGRVRTVMVVDTFGAAVNVVLDYCWIFGAYGFPEWGIAGAGWATTIAIWLKTAVYFALFLRPRDAAECDTRRGWPCDGQLIRRLLRFGAVSGLQILLECGAFTLFTNLIGRLDVEALATSGFALNLTSTSLALNLNNFAFMPIWGVGIAASTMVGRRLGEERPDLATRSTWSCLFWAMAYMSVICLFYLFWPEMALLPHQVESKPEEFDALRPVTIVLLRFVAAFGLIDAANVIFSGALKGAGDVRFVLWSSFGIAVASVAATWLGMAAGLGLYWCWSVLTAWVAALCVGYVLRFFQGYWRSMRVIEPTE